MQELIFTERVETVRTGQPSSCGFIETVGDAIEIIQSLSPEKRDEDHWQRAETTLCEAAECPTNPTLLVFAEQAFREALKTEGWLQEN